MKKLFLLLLTIATVSANAQSDKYTEAMQKNLTLLNDAKSAEDLQKVSSAFLRVAEAEKTQWLPYYYAGLAQAWIGYMDQSADKDALANNAKTMLEKAEALEKNAETYTLSYMLENIQMLVDPASRWQTHGMKAQQALNMAKQADPNNPRVYYLEGTNVLYTPEQFGGGKAKAKPILEKSIALYDTFEVKPLHPKWGKEQAEAMLAEANK